jgi:hypothetical protein
MSEIEDKLQLFCTWSLSISQSCELFEIKFNNVTSILCWIFQNNVSLDFLIMKSVLLVYTMYCNSTGTL